MQYYVLGVIRVAKLSDSFYMSHLMDNCYLIIKRWNVDKICWIIASDKCRMK